MKGAILHPANPPARLPMTQEDEEEEEPPHGRKERERETTKKPSLTPRRPCFGPIKGGGFGVWDSKTFLRSE